MTQIHDLTVLELAAAVRGRELSPTEITGHYLDRIERLNAEVGAFYTVTADLARDQASRAEKKPKTPPSVAEWRIARQKRLLREAIRAARARHQHALDDSEDYV